MVIIVVFQTTYSSSTLDTFNLKSIKVTHELSFRYLLEVLDKIATSVPSGRAIELFLESQSLN
jgi:hypothetical protein